MDTPIDTLGVRFLKRATWKMVLGFCGAFGIGAFFVIITNEGDLPKSPLWSVFAAVPFMYCVIGTIETVIQRPYRDLRAVWKTLKRSKRILLGLFLIEAAFLTFILGVASLFHLCIIAYGND
jgi:hypothetical protein